MLKQCWDNVSHINDEIAFKGHYLMKNGCIDVVQRWFNVVSTLATDIVSILCSIENPISDFVSFSTSDQRYFNSDLNAETTLIRRWNVGSVVSVKKLILRNILPATLLTKWDLKVFFKDYAKTSATTVFMNFFWWQRLIIHLRFSSF